MDLQFTILGLEPLEQDLLGIWQPQSLPKAVSFGAGSTTEEPEVVVWSVMLPANMEQAQLALRERSNMLQFRHEAMVSAQENLAQLPPIGEEPRVSFSTTNEFDSAETNLLQNIQHIRAGDMGHAELSFSASAEATPETAAGWDKTVADYHQFMQQVFRLLRPALQVETKIEAQIMAHTRLGLTGDLHTTWLQSATPAHARLHYQVLSLSMESRTAVLQLLAQISSGAAALAIKFNLPGGPLMALPAAWQYLQDVTTQAAETQARLQRLRTINRD